jgi:transcriptional regulator with XRE-family HTH domain
MMEEVIGKKIKNLRLQHKHTLRDLAEIISMDHTRLSKIENGKRKITVDYLCKIADVYGIHICYFFDEDYQDYEKWKEVISEAKKKNITAEEILLKIRNLNL